MWYWSGGFWWPGFVLMAVFCIAMMVMMARMMGRGGMGMCGFGRWFEPRDNARSDAQTRGERPHSGSPTPD
jgi:hypothetical protein